MSSEPDWTRFRKRIFIERPPGEVYECWARKSKIEAWFLEKADYREPGRVQVKDHAEKGDQFSWKWHNWDFEETGHILEANGRDRIAFTFGAGGNVYIELAEREDSTEVILVQDSIPPDETSKMQLFVGCSTGWTFWLANLKAYLEHGITLHAKGLKQDETEDLVNS